MRRSAVPRETVNVDLPTPERDTWGGNVSCRALRYHGVPNYSLRGDAVHFRAGVRPLRPRKGYAERLLLLTDLVQTKRDLT